ncbi:conserved exported hypothetical protein [Vibrio crassostreae]|uniref:hypothetical protein n=1 Tax=Vibrio crassostreae TaxID=246167 RepID=UPI000F501547|nr:hypothetical protein [Vibrio crassostreae]RPF18926.1 hypothetical protein EDB12_1927 [Vibrio crassostreae]CAK2849679.1 conserved exported hypothetical protein [Vibrio crassostreae]
MKLNNFFVMSATALTMASGAVYAADDVATADAIWTGAIGNSVPSSNLIITGLGGGDIQTGELYVTSEGTFTSSEVVLEARDFDSTNTTTGDRQPLANWTYVTSQVLVGGQITQDAQVSVFNGGTELTAAQPNSYQGSYVELSVANTTEIQDISVEGTAQVIVQMAASYDGSL